MSSLFDETATKKATNLSINSDLLAKAKALKINLSATLERALENELKNASRQTWLQENQQAISSMNDFTDKHGLFADAYRNF